MSKAVVRTLEQVEPVPCPCGESRRLITRSDGAVASLHVTRISKAQAHLHKRTTEFYYVLSGSGSMELDGETFEVKPGTAVAIPPGVAHRGAGEFETVVFCVPAFDGADEFLVRGAKGRGGT